jgi:hypothetical protein
MQGEILMKNSLEDTYGELRKDIANCNAGFVWNGL